MAAAYRTVLLVSAMLHVTSCEFRKSERSRNYSEVVPFLEKWLNRTKTSLLTVVFDEHVTGDVAQHVLARVNVPAKLVTLGHLMSLDPANSSSGYRIIDPGGCVLLLFSGIDQLNGIVTSTHLASFWQPENSYILENHGSSISFGEFCRWSERLWKLHRVYKLIGFIGDGIIRYDPFDVACRSYDELGSCDYTRNNSIVANDSSETDVFGFADEERRNFGMYPLRISIFRSTTMAKQGNKYGGIDYKYLKEITRRMNVTPILVFAKETYGWKENGVFFGAIGQMVYKQTDVSFNQYFVKDYLSEQIEFTAAVTSDKLCALVPRASRIPDYLVIVKTFSHGAWLLILAGHFVIAAIYTTLRNKERVNQDDVRCDGSWSSEIRFDGHFSKGQRDISLDIAAASAWTQRGYSPYGVFPTETTRDIGSRWKLFKGATFSRFALLVKYLTKVILQSSQPFQNCAPRFPERLFVMCSLWLSLILNGVFTSQLAASFSKRHYYDDIDTLEQLEESGLAILTNSRDTLQDALTDATSSVMKRLHARMLYANESEIKRRLFRAKDAAFLHRVTTIPARFNKFQRDQLHVVKECPKNYILAYVLTKGSPFRGRVNSILTRLNSAGFYERWYRNVFEWDNHLAANEVQPTGEKLGRQGDSSIHDVQAIFGHVVVIGNKSTNHNKITMKHLVIPFTIFHVGLVTATIVFICERRRASSYPVAIEVDKPEKAQ